MAYIEDERIPIVSKSSNYPIAAVFSTTLDDIYISMIANNCNNYYFNDSQHSGIIGTKIDSNRIYETYIGNMQNEQITKIAKFRNDHIFLETDTSIRGNILPSSNINNIGTLQNQWKSLYLSDKINDITVTEINTLSGIKSNIQTQLNASNTWVLSIDSNQSNNVLATSNNLGNTILQTSNIISNYITLVDSNQSNYVLQTSNIISNRITNLNADQIANGSINRFIINNEYNYPLTINDTLTTSNLNVIGTTTTINTTTYKTENLEINTSALDGPGLKVIQNGTQDIAQFIDSNTIVAIIKDGGNVGIGSTTPTEKLDIIGNIKVSGNFNNITSTEINTLSGIKSNIQTQLDTSNTWIINLNTNQSNNVLQISNNLSNTILQTSNIVSNRITLVDSNQSNNVLQISNNLGNTILQTSNIISNRITLVDSNQSNNVLQISNNIGNIILQTSNIVSSRITLVDSNQSNNVLQTSNIISNRITLVDSNQSNNVLRTSNIISNRITNLNADQIANGSINRFIINNQYNYPLIVNDTLTASNLNIIGTTTTINTTTYKTENLEINTSAIDGPGLKVVQNGSQDIAQFIDSNTIVVVIRDGGNVGIGSALPTEKLDINGGIKFSTNINNTSSNEIEFIKGITSPIQTQIINTSNYIISKIIDSSNFTNNTRLSLDYRINNLNIDNIYQGTSNKFIINNTIDGDVNITGKLTVSYVDITDLGVSYDNNGATQNTDLLSYINNVASNLNYEPNIYLGYNKYVLQNNENGKISLSSTPASKLVYLNNVTSDIQNQFNNLTPDQFANGTSNKYIVNNQYNSSLTVNNNINCSNLNITTDNNIPPLKITQNSSANIVEIYDTTSNIFVIQKGGKVGIGITNPSARLHIATDTFNSGSQNLRYFNYSTNIIQTSDTLTDICAIFDSSIWVKSWIASSSDFRIKKGIEDIKDDIALQQILAIQPKTYKYIDGTSNISYGFIAQQIKEIIPEAIKIKSEIIPNIYQICNYSSNGIYFENINNIPLTSNLDIDIITSDGNRNVYKIQEYSNNYITLDKDLNSSNVFAYGTRVDDFHTLNKEYIFTLNVCATQELHKIIQQQQQTINEQNNRINQLESLIQQLDTRLKNIEQ